MSKFTKYYMHLQLRRIKRKCSEMGVHPLVLVILGSIIFIFASLFLFNKTQFAPWIYVGIGLITTYSIIDIDHLRPLIAIFSRDKIIIIRLLENSLIALPFLLFLTYKMKLLSVLLLFLGQCCIAFLPIKSSTSFNIPTPFKRTPFEYIVGFRSTLLLIVLAYFLALKGIQVDNSNLSFSSIGLLFLLGIAYHLKIEDSYFVWIQDTSPSEFLFRKALTAIKNSTILSLPATIIVIIFFPTHWYIPVIIHAYGFILLSVFILAKYAAFPQEISIPQAIILGLTFLIPPMLLYTIPAFYKKAKLKLSLYL